jgi:hypothetical protein
MKIKRHTTYTAEVDGHELEIPFEFCEGSEVLKISADGQQARLGVLVQDDSPADPFEEYDDGDFFQFNRRRIHDCSRPDTDDFRRLIRQYPGRVFTIDTAGEGYRIAAGPFTVADTKGRQSVSDSAIEDADGYYIVPEDATDKASYAKGALEQYSAFCEGDVYGVCVWEYTLQEDGSWSEPDRENECWGYYGRQYAEEQLKSEVER